MPERKVKWLSRSLMLGPYMTLCTSEAKFKAALKYLDVAVEEYPKWLSTPQADATTHFLDSSGGSYAVVVCIRVSKDVTPIQVAALLVHEAVHIWQHHCGWIGEQSPSSEFEAYAIQHIAQELMYAFADELKTKRGKP